MIKPAFWAAAAFILGIGGFFCPLALLTTFTATQLAAFHLSQGILAGILAACELAAAVSVLNYQAGREALDRR